MMGFTSRYAKLIALAAAAYFVAGLALSVIGAIRPYEESVLGRASEDIIYWLVSPEYIMGAIVNPIFLFVGALTVEYLHRIWRAAVRVGDRLPPAPDSKD